MSSYAAPDLWDLDVEGRRDGERWLLLDGAGRVRVRLAPLP
jgi:hypothetical protein